MLCLKLNPLFQEKLKMRYRIFKSSHCHTLAKEVNIRIEQGWRPQGGVFFVYHSGYKETWAQAMVND